MPQTDPLRAAVPLALAIVNARVHTGDSNRPWADAVLVRGRTIVAVGSSAELRKRAGGDATLIDARGRLVLPVRSDGALAAGQPADLLIVERRGELLSTASDDEVVLAIEGGRVVIDRETVLGGGTT